MAAVTSAAWGVPGGAVSENGTLCHRGGRRPRRRRLIVLYAPVPTGDLLPGFYRRAASNVVQQEPRSMAPTARFLCTALTRWRACRPAIGSYPKGRRFKSDPRHQKIKGLANLANRFVRLTVRVLSAFDGVAEVKS